MRLLFAISVLSLVACTDQGSVVLVTVNATNLSTDITGFHVAASVAQTTRDYAITTAAAATSTSSFAIQLPPSLQGTLAVHVDALGVGNTPLGAGDGSTEIKVGGRSDVMITIGGVAPDMAMPDLTAVDLAGVDLASNCVEGTVRCKIDDHRKQQRCTSGNWVDETCAVPVGTPTPPIAACTEATHACIDTSWGQWSLVTTASPRFTTMTPTAGQDVVVDAQTGLMWQLKLTGADDPSSPYTFANANAHCAALNYGGFSGDWRVPSPVELFSLVDFTQSSGPYIAAPFRADTLNFWYWTSTPLAGTSQFWYVLFNDGSVNTQGATTNPSRVRCVR